MRSFRAALRDPILSNGECGHTVEDARFAGDDVDGAALRAGDAVSGLRLQLQRRQHARATAADFRQAGLKAVAIANGAGNYIYPYEPNLVDAADLLKSVPSLGTLSSTTATSIASALSLVDPAYSKPKKGAKPSTLQKTESQAYPLATFTYAIVRPDDKNVSTLKQFLAFALTPAEQKQGIGGTLQFAPLPSSIVKADTTAINAL